ncbi:MAG: hypothetical protein KGL02_03530 [Acidobacteriota bacterium]|nr:hypothetical protein [Acidobacteriota bacterium]
MALLALVPTAAAQEADEQFTRPAPTPSDWTALAKLPDFTGVWETPLGNNSLVVPPGEAKQNPQSSAARSKFPTFPMRQPLPLTPAWAAKVAALKAHAAQDTSAANCLPPGMPEIMGQPYPYEFLLTPGQVTIVGEAYMIVRHIYTDGRPLPQDPDQTFFGTSVGHWEGTTLVAESIGFSPQTEIVPGIPHSDKMKVIERFTLTDPDTMSVETTVIDPVALTHPYTTTRILKRHRNWTIQEYICEQNNRNSVSDNGQAGVDITPPPPPEPDSK